MAKRKQVIDEKKILKYIKEGRGSGTHENYIPWIKVQDFSSLGRATRVKGYKSNRVHHFMSDLETRYFYLLEGNHSVVDIREQYPLLDRDLVKKICLEKDIKQPIDLDSKTPIVFTTDFFITVEENGVKRNIARTLKYSHDLEKKRVIEKFEIERSYWLEKDVDWGIVTEKDINMTVVNNIIWIHKSYYLEDIIDIECGLNKDKLIEYLIKLIDSISNKNSENLKIFNLLNSLDMKYSAKDGTFLYLLKYSIINNIIDVDMEKDLTKNYTIKEILKGVRLNVFSC